MLSHWTLFITIDDDMLFNGDDDGYNNYDSNYDDDGADNDVDDDDIS